MGRARTLVAARVERLAAGGGKDCASVRTSRTSSSLLPALRAASGCVVWSEHCGASSGLSIAWAPSESLKQVLNVTNQI